jgi:predicted ABC-type ATPase
MTCIFSLPAEKREALVAKLQDEPRPKARDRIMQVYKLRDTKVFLHVHDAYDPNEKRDPGGKWTKGGGSGAATKGEAPSRGKKKPADKHSSAAALLQHEYPKEMSPEHFLSKQPPEVLDRIREVEAKIHREVPSDALESQGGHKRPDGSWTPERRKVHDQIMREILNPEAIKAATPKPGEDPVFTMLGGRGGSGKSWFSKTGVVPKGHLILDNDAIKAKLPEYQGWNAALLHEEASHIFDRIDAAAREAGLNIAHDATLKTYRSAEKRANEYRDKGYKVHGHYMFVPPHISAQRAVKRFMGPGGRYVPPSYILSSTTNESSFDQLRPLLDKWSLYRNDVEGKEPELVAMMGEKPKTDDTWFEDKFDDGRSLWLRR